jgi:hypothetical protein
MVLLAGPDLDGSRSDVLCGQARVSWLFFFEAGLCRTKLAFGPMFLGHRKTVEPFCHERPRGRTRIGIPQLGGRPSFEWTFQQPDIEPFPRG